MRRLDRASRAWRAAPPAVARDNDLRRWRAGFPDASSIADLAPRHQGCAIGVVSRIRLVPGKHLEVTIEDGSGSLIATFTGRSELPGVGLGRGLRVAGCVAAERRDAVAMRNPAWAPVSDPRGT